MNKAPMGILADRPYKSVFVAINATGQMSESWSI